jgi:NAD(P)-dependent dehydrogenase (short-subunit alcohol dehydrogenase family)
MAVTLDGAFHCTQAALPLLLASDAAAVVNIGGPHRPHRRAAAGACGGGEGRARRADPRAGA